MHAWEQIQITIDYIENHISEDYNIETLSKMAALSPFYYQRLFKRLVKKPVIEYIKLRRMARATEDLLQEDKRILDIALDLGFSSHEHFTRTFKDTFGITPEAYRKNPVPFNKMTKPQLILNYKLIDENVPLISDGIVLEISRKIVEVPRNFIGFKVNAPIQLVSELGVESGEDPLYTLWDELHNIKKDIVNLDSSGVEIGVTHPCDKEGYFSYFAGVESRSNMNFEKFKNWEISTGEYIVCLFEAENFKTLVMDVLYKAQRYLFQVWLPNHNIMTEPFCIEYYEGHNEDTMKMEVWVKVVPN